MSYDTPLPSPDRSTATGVPPLTVETFDGWAPDLTAPALASVCMRAEAASR